MNQTRFFNPGNPRNILKHFSKLEECLSLWRLDKPRTLIRMPNEALNGSIAIPVDNPRLRKEDRSAHWPIVKISATKAHRPLVIMNATNTHIG
jgi:hypothetical protein